MRKLFGLVVPLIAALIFLGGAFWWGSSCSAVEKKVDDGTFQVRRSGGGWFVTAEEGYSKTAEYLGRFAGILAKRKLNDVFGREAFKLAGSCGGSSTVGYWASKKGLGPDGKKLPRVTWPVPGDRGRLPGDRGGPVFEFVGGLLIVIGGGITMVWLHRRRRMVYVVG